MSTIQSAPAPAPMPRIELPPEPLATVKPPRLVSLDIFRGITIAAMILVNYPGHGGTYWPLEHADWNGWTPTDLIFPFFLFIVGVATPFSMAKRAGGEQTRTQLLAHIWARAISLFVLGELLTAIPYTNFDEIPAGYAWIKPFRMAVIGFCAVGIILVLFPWRSRKVQLVLPIAMLVLVYVIAIAVHVIIKKAGPPGFKFGNGLLNPTQLRIPGVLQRIGICYGIAATIGLYFGWRMVLVFAILFMAIYSALMLKVPFPNHETGSLTEKDNLSRRIDEWLLIREGRWNHAYSHYPDNEGAISTLPAISTVLIGILIGVWLRTFRPAGERNAGLLVLGLFTLLAGMALDRWLMPINKNIWTPSFTVYTAGMAMLCLGTVFFVVDLLGYKAWALPFKIYGMNAIAAFIAAGLVFKIAFAIKIKAAEGDVSLWTWSQQRIADAMSHLGGIDTGNNRSLAFALSYVVVILLLMSFLYVLKIFVKV